MSYPYCTASRQLSNVFRTCLSNEFSSSNYLVFSSSAPSARYRAHAGFSLLEVLISLVIFSIGFLGLASLQHIALKLTHDSVLQNTATNLAESLITRIHVEGETADISSWQSLVHKSLPEGSGQLARQGDVFILTLQGQESSHSANVSAGQTYQRSFNASN